jgi:hypothetical protein
MNQFYLTLPSNSVGVQQQQQEQEEGGGEAGAPESTVPLTSRNTQSYFRVQLPHRISLDNGDWDVALCELIYTHSWYNIDKSDGEGRYIAFYEPATKKLTVCDVEPGHYGTPEELATAVNLCTSRVCDQLGIAPVMQLSYDSLTKRMVMNVAQQQHQQQQPANSTGPTTTTVVSVGEKLRYMLGFDADDLKRVRAQRPGDAAISVKARYPVDLRGGFAALYLYCDVVSNQVVGHVTAPLLRVVAVQGHHDDIISTVFTNPHYLPVVKKEIDSIEKSTKDDQDNHVKFLYGKTIVKLHFRRRKYSLL